MDIGKLTNQGMLQPTGFQRIAASEKPELPVDGVGSVEQLDSKTLKLRKFAAITSQQAAEVLFSKDEKKTKDAMVDMHSVWSYDTSGSALSDTVFDPATKTMYTGVGVADTWHLTAFDEKGAIKWSHTGEEARSTPVLDKEGNVYFRTDTHLRVFTPDGKEKWSYNTGRDTVNNSKPVIGPDGTVYLVTHNPDRGYTKNDIELVAVKDGKRLWGQPAHGVGCEPQVMMAQDGTVVLVADKEIPKKGLTAKLFKETEIKAFLTGFDPATGSERFRTEVNRWDTYTEDGISQGPDGTIYACHGYNQVSAFTPKGAHKWTYEMQDKLHTSSDRRERPRVGAAPSFDNEGNVFLASKSVGGYPEGYLVSLNGDGKEKWCQTFKEGADTRPQVNEKGEILLGSLDGQMLVFDKDGKKTKQFVVGHIVGDNFCFGNDGVIYLNTHKKIVAFQPDLAKLEMQKLQEKESEEPVQSQVPGIQLKDGGVEIDGVTLNKRKKKLK